MNMTNKKPLNLQVNIDGLETFCRQLIKRSRDISKTHDAMATLESFITVFGKAAHGTHEYAAVDEVIKRFTEQTRQQLLEEKSRLLVEVLRAHDIEGIARIHTPLSRSGFYHILESAVGELTPSDLSALKIWVKDWLRDARHKAEAASGYPDALDFNKAGVNIYHYQAMADVDHSVNHED